MCGSDRKNSLRKAVLTERFYVGGPSGPSRARGLRGVHLADRPEGIFLLDAAGAVHGRYIEPPPDGTNDDARYILRILNERKGARSAIAAEEGLSIEELQLAIAAYKAAKDGIIERGPTTFTDLESRPTLDTRKLSGPQVEAVVEDSTLGRLHRRYAELLATVELPLEGYKHKTQARVAARLSSTFGNLQTRREKLGFEPLPTDERVMEARRLRSLFYYRFRQRARHTLPDE